MNEAQKGFLDGLRGQAEQVSLNFPFGNGVVSLTFPRGMNREQVSQMWGLIDMFITGWVNLLPEEAEAADENS